jgi:hypothetical protein
MNELQQLQNIFQASIERYLLILYLLKNFPPVSINGQSIFESATFPNNETVNLRPIKTFTKPKNRNKISTTLHIITLSKMLQNALHCKLKLLQSLFNQTLLINKPFLSLNILLLNPNWKRREINSGVKS